MSGCPRARSKKPSPHAGATVSWAFMSGRLLRATASWSLALTMGIVMVASCSLSNISADDCASDTDCAAAFGLGSACLDGFCSDPQGCETGHECRRRYGGGACVEGFCVDRLPDDPNGNCVVVEPDDLSGTLLVGEEAPVVLGGIFRLGDTSEPARADAAKLALREINEVGGLNGSRPLAMVICNNDGPDASSTVDERRVLTQQSIDHLAGTLGVPFVVGPNRSSDSIAAVNHLINRGYPSVSISPSATSPALTNQPDRLDPDDALGLFWRTCPSDILQGQLLADQVVGQLPVPDPAVSQVSVMYISDTYGEGLANEFIERWGAPNADLHPFDENVDVAALVDSVVLDAPDALLIIVVEAQRALDILTAVEARPALADVPIYLTDGSKDEQVLLSADVPAAVQQVIFTRVVGTAPAGPQTASSDVFFANYSQEFGVSPEGQSFTANTYDALYIGAAGVVFASAGGANTYDGDYDGRNVADGLSRLVGGAAVPVGSLDWSSVKSNLTSGDMTLDIEGISGPLDFDVATGEAVAPIEVWQPSNDAAACGNAPPCFAQVLAAIP